MPARFGCLCMSRTDEDRKPAQPAAQKQNAPPRSAVYTAPSAAQNGGAPATAPAGARLFGHNPQPWQLASSGHAPGTQLPPASGAAPAPGRIYHDKQAMPAQPYCGPAGNASPLMRQNGNDVHRSEAGPPGERPSATAGYMAPFQQGAAYGEDSAASRGTLEPSQLWRRASNPGAAEVRRQESAGPPRTFPGVPPGPLEAAARASGPTYAPKEPTWQGHDGAKSMDQTLRSVPSHPPALGVPQNASPHPPGGPTASSGVARTSAPPAPAARPPPAPMDSRPSPPPPPPAARATSVPGGPGGNLPPLPPAERRSAPVHVFTDPSPPYSPEQPAWNAPRAPGRPPFPVTPYDDPVTRDNPQPQVVPTTVTPPRPVNSNLIGSVMQEHMSVTHALETMTDAMGDNHSAGKQVKKIKLLGRGGFGTVYLATMDGGKAKVALKELSSPLEYRPYSQNPSDVLGTLREAAIQALMVHTNIVRTYWADVSVVHPQTGKPLGLKFASVMKGHVVEDCTTSSAEGGAPQAEWLSVEGLMSETKRLADDHVLPDLVGLNVRIAMEYCELGSLIDYVAPRTKGAKVVPINVAIGGGMEKTLCAALTALDIARGLKLLHKYQIVHGDLKPHNILIAANHASKDDGSLQDSRGFVAKLSDFGLSKHMRRGETQVNGITHGSVEYMPLEARQSRTVTKASDVYAFGIIMWELWHNDCWAPHFKAKQQKLKQQFEAVGRVGMSSKTIAPHCWPQCPEEYATIVSDCLDKDPARRPKISQVARRLELFIDKRLWPDKVEIVHGATGHTGSTGPGPANITDDFRF